MKTLIIFISMLLATVGLAVPTNAPPPQYLTVTTDTNGALTAPLSFWMANTAAIAAAAGAGSQSPLIADVNAAHFSITNLNKLQATNSLALTNAAGTNIVSSTGQTNTVGGVAVYKQAAGALSITGDATFAGNGGSTSTYVATATDSLGHWSWQAPGSSSFSGNVTQFTGNSIKDSANVSNLIVHAGLSSTGSTYADGLFGWSDSTGEVDIGDSASDHHGTHIQIADSSGQSISLTASGGITLAGAVTGSSLIIPGTTALNGLTSMTATVTNQTTLKGWLFANGASNTFTGPIDIQSAATNRGATTMLSTLNVAGFTTVAGESNSANGGVAGTLVVAGAQTNLGTFKVLGTTTVAGETNTGNGGVGGTLVVAGAQTNLGNLVVLGTLTTGVAGDVTGTTAATVVSTVGGVTAANVASGANLANAATTASTANTIVKRDSVGAIEASSLYGQYVVSAGNNPQKVIWILKGTNYQASTFSTPFTFTASVGSTNFTLSAAVATIANGWVPGMQFGISNTQYWVELVKDSTHVSASASGHVGGADRNITASDANISPPEEIIFDNTGSVVACVIAGDGSIVQITEGNSASTEWVSSTTGGHYLVEYSSGRLHFNNTFGEVLGMYDNAANASCFINQNYNIRIPIGNDQGPLSFFSSILNANLSQLGTVTAMTLTTSNLATFKGGNTNTDLGASGNTVLTVTTNLTSFTAPYATASTAAIFDSSKNLVSSATTSAELAGIHAGGTIAAVSGANLTSLNGSSVSTGTVSGAFINIDGTTIKSVGGQLQATGTSDASTNGMTVVYTNLSLGTIYTNNYGFPMTVQGVSAVYTEAAVAGASAISLSLTNGAFITNINTAQVTALGVATGSMTNAFPTFVVTNGGTFKFNDASSGAGNSATVLGMELTYVQQLCVATSFAGNGIGLTNVQANTPAWTNQAASGSTTNFIINLSGAPNVVINLAADGCVTGLTNGPGSVAVTFNCGDGANHNVLIPAAMHLQGATNIISQVKGTNDLIVVTNGFVLNMVFKPVQVVANPNATNDIAFMGESGN